MDALNLCNLCNLWITGLFFEPFKTSTLLIPPPVDKRCVMNRDEIMYNITQCVINITQCVMKDEG